MENEELLKGQTELLSELLQDEYKPEHPNLVTAYNEVKQFINTDFEKAVNESHMPNRDGLMDSLNSALNRVEIFNDYPEMAGDTFIGIWDSGKKQVFADSKANTPVWLSHREQIQNYGIPVIWTKGDKSDRFVENTFGIRLEISPEKYDDLLGLPKSGISLKKVIRYLYIWSPDIDADSTFVKFPENTDWDSDAVNALVNKLDYALIYWDSAKFSGIKDFVDQLNLYHIPFTVVWQSNEELAEINKKLGNVSTRSRSRITQRYISRQTVSRKNYVFTDEMYEALLRSEEKLYTNIARLKSEVVLLKNDIVNLGGNDSEAEGKISELKNTRQKALDENEGRLNTFRGQARKLLKLADALEKLYDNIAVQESDMSGGYQYSNMACYRYLNAGISAIRIYNYSGNEDSSCLKIANDCLEKLDKTDFRYKYILKLYISHFTENEPDQVDLRRLKSDDDKVEIVAKARIWFYKELDLSRDELFDNIQHISEPETPDELYLQGRNYLDQGKDKLAYELLLKAWKAGAKYAEEDLHDLAIDMEKKNGPYTMEDLIPYMVPQACADVAFRVLKLCCSNFKYLYLNVSEEGRAWLRCVHGLHGLDNHDAEEMAITLLKMAASGGNGNWVARMVIADYYFCKLPVGHLEVSGYQPTTFAVGRYQPLEVVNYPWNSDLAKQLIGIYKEVANKLDSEENKNWRDECLYKAGLLYYRLGDCRAAFKIFSSKNEWYPEEFLFCSQMAFEGNGTSVDLDQAEQWASQAAQGNWDDYRGRDCAKCLLAAIQEKKQQVEYNRRPQPSPEPVTHYYDDDDDGDDCCYIVSAVCKNLNFMKEYHRTVIMIGSMRNRFLKLHPEMREMIDSYYTFAPEVIEKIDASGNAKEIYQYLWSHFITPIVNLMHKRDYVKAMTLYIQMVYQQFRKYQIPCPEYLMAEAENYLGKSSL